MIQKKRLIPALITVAVLALLVFALMPSPLPVSVSQVKEGDFVTLVEEEGKTELRNPHRVSAPISGFLRRVELEPGDEVNAGDVVFELEAMPTPALDARAREQAREQIAAARARLESAEAELESRQTRMKLAQTEFARAENLYERGAISAEEMDRRETERDSARAAERSARHAVEVARFELEAARAVIEVADGERARSDQPSLEVRAPIGGVVTRRQRCCEGPVQAGEDVLELGDLSELEVRVDLLSLDAVRVRPGMRVEIERWGEETVLEGEVRRVEPAGFTRVSALGVDEQRVPVRVALTSPRERWQFLGEGYRVEARFILSEREEVTQIPTSALFRADDRWHVYRVSDGRASRQPVETGARSGLWSEIKEGLDAGDYVITHPGERVEDGVRVAPEVRGAP